MKPRVREVIVVEGRYDKNTLLQAVDAVVVETGGFAVFRNGEKAAYLRRLAEKRGVIRRGSLFLQTPTARASSSGTISRASCRRSR